RRGFIVCGPQTDENFGKEIVELSERLKAPILADPLSQLRAGSHDKKNIISSYDALLRFEKVRERLKPDYIIRFGAMPVSKNYSFYVQDHRDVLQIVVEDRSEEHTSELQSRFDLVCRLLLEKKNNMPILQKKSKGTLV